MTPLAKLFLLNLTIFSSMDLSFAFCTVSRLNYTFSSQMLQVQSLKYSHVCVAAKRHQMAIASTAFHDSGLGMERGASLQHTRFNIPELQLLIHTGIHLDEGRGGFLIPCLSEVAPKAACSCYRQAALTAGQAPVDGTSSGNLHGTNAPSRHSTDASAASSQVLPGTSHAEGGRQSVGPHCKPHPHSGQSLDLRDDNM